MKHCSFCKKPLSEDWREDLFEGLWICLECIEKVEQNRIRVVRAIEQERELQSLLNRVVVEER
jgi:hypothetical protein